LGIILEIIEFLDITGQGGAKAAREAGKTAGKGQQRGAVVPSDRRKF
jgi:hypothetical protein